MTTAAASLRVNRTGAMRHVLQPFQGLSLNDPSFWPPLLRYALCVVVAAAVFVALCLVWLRHSSDELEAARAKELALRGDFQKKLTQAAPLDSLKRQRDQALQALTRLEKQLPSKVEMDALVSDISQAGIAHHLHFELLRPGPLLFKGDYAEPPIAMRVTGRYHDMGAFAAAIAHLPWIVALNNLSLTPQKDAVLVLDATAHTYRLLDDEERAARQRAAAAEKEKKK